MFSTRGLPALYQLVRDMCAITKCPSREGGGSVGRGGKWGGGGGRGECLFCPTTPQELIY